MSVESIGIGEVGTYYPELLRERVLVVSNEDEPVRVGNITGFYPMQSGQLLPQVTLSDGEILVCFSALLPYDPDLLQLFNSMDHKRRYQLITKIFDLQFEMKRLLYGKER